MNIDYCALIIIIPSGTNKSDVDRKLITHINIHLKLARLNFFFTWENKSILKI